MYSLRTCYLVRVYGPQSLTFDPRRLAMSICRHCEGDSTDSNTHSNLQEPPSLSYDVLMITPLQRNRKRKSRTSLVSARCPLVNSKSRDRDELTRSTVLSSPRIVVSGIVLDFKRAVVIERYFGESGQVAFVRTRQLSAPRSEMAVRENYALRSHQESDLPVHTMGWPV